MKNIFTINQFKIVVFVIVFSFFSSITNGQDTIKINKTWGNDTSINNNVVINPGVILTINSGVTITMTGNYSIECDNGFIHANGTNSQLITFTCNNTNIGWGGINITNNSASDSSVFTYCQFLYGKLPKGGYLYSINTSNTTIFDNCTFSYNKINNGSHSITRCVFFPVVHCTTFYYYSMSAILFSSNSIKITNSSFTNNKSASTFYADSSYYYISHCTFTNDSTYNYIASGSCNYDESAIAINSGNGEIDNNAIYNNTGIGLSIVSTNSSIVNSNYIYQQPKYGLYTEASLVKLYNNIIANNDTAAVINGSLCSFTNNTITFNNFGIQTILPTVSGGADVYFYNSIIWNNGTGLNGNMNITIENCDLPYSSANLTSFGFTVKSFKNNINVSPNYTNVPTGKGNAYSQVDQSWIPLAGSKCINAGAIDLASDDLPGHDYNGNSRVKYGFPDMGAFEVSISSLTINASNCHITGNTNWIADNINVYTDVTIDSLATLTIFPGSIVYFHGCYKLNAFGNIIAKGNKSTSNWYSIYNQLDKIIIKLPFGLPGFRGLPPPIRIEKAHTDSIIFTMSNPIYKIDSINAVFWHGIILNKGNAADSSIFRYCRFELAIDSGLWDGAALNIAYRNKVLVSNCEFRYNKSLQEASCIAAFQSGIDIEGCNYYSNKGSEAVLINSSDLRIANCYFYNNSGTYNSGNDLNMYFSQNASVINNIFRNNVTLTNSASFLTNCEMYGNTYMISSYSKLYNTVCMGSVVIDRNSNPSFFNCIFPGDTITIPAAYINSCYYEKYDNPSFVWYRNTSSTNIYNYERNSLYPSVNRGTTNFPDVVAMPDIDIFGNPRMLNNLIDIGAIENQGELATFNQEPIGANICEGDSISFTAIASDTAYYQWQKDGSDIPGANKQLYKISSVSVNDEGNYTCVVSNAYGVSSSNPAFIHVNSAPDITNQPVSALISKNSPVTLIATADGSKPLKHIWLKDGLQLSDTTFKLSIDSFTSDKEGTYVCEMTNSCGSITTTPAVLSLTPSICMVTVFRPNKFVQGHNRIVWEKESKVQYSKFKIYRESAVAGYYDSIGSVPYNKLSVFDDTVADPKAQAYLYKITGVGTDGKETDINACQLHKTIHLLVTRGEMGGIQLDWDQYIGLSYRTYNIFRRVNGKDFSIIHSMASSTRTWTDDTIVEPNDTLYYYVSINNPNGCYPTGNKKAGSDIYSQSVSNMEDNRIQSTGILKTNINDGLNLSCYPNPFQDITNISYNLTKPSLVKLELFNLVGERIAVLVNSKQPAGFNKYILNTGTPGMNSEVYILRLSVNNSITTKKLVKIK
jgi:hypothetical protein